MTLFVNWLVKPFSMAFFAWLFPQHLFAAWIEPETARNHAAGLIILAAAPCTAMVFVWSYLTEGDPAYTLVQVALNDLIMLFAFAPIVMFLYGVANVVVPSQVLITSVVAFIVIPLAAGWLTRTLLIRTHGVEWFEQRLLPDRPGQGPRQDRPGGRSGVRPGDDPDLHRRRVTISPAFPTPPAGLTLTRSGPVRKLPATSAGADGRAPDECPDDAGRCGVGTPRQGGRAGGV